MNVLVLLGSGIGGVVAWHWGKIRVTWQDWRVTVGRLKRARKLFFGNMGRGFLVTGVAAIVLFVLVKRLYRAMMPGDVLRRVVAMGEVPYSPAEGILARLHHCRDGVRENFVREVARNP